MQEHEAEDSWQYTGQSEEVPEKVQHVKIGSHVPRIPNEAFFQHKTLEAVTLSSSSSVREIGKRAFKGCKRLKKIDLNEGLGRIGEFAFKGCTWLTVVKLPSTVHSIDDFAFQFCTTLMKLGLQEGLERIGKFAFEGC
eukprot:scaffold7674_cov76-Cylindrotheca_fusiformis.AAC.1